MGHLTQGCERALGTTYVPTLLDSWWTNLHELKALLHSVAVVRFRLVLKVMMDPHEPRNAKSATHSADFLRTELLHVGGQMQPQRDRI